MDKKCVYVAFSNQKGGVGKSAFTTLVASYLHYAGNKNVAVIDCDYPQHSIFAMRERDKTMINSNDFYKEMLVNQFSAIDKKAYPVVTTQPENAIAVAKSLVKDSETPFDVVFFDLSGTVFSTGILQSMMNLDYIFCPITTDRLVMQSSLTFATTLQEFIQRTPKAPLQGIFLFWNQLVKSEYRELYVAYNKVISSLKVNRLQTEIPFTIKYKKEMSPSNRQVFRSTLFPANKALIKGTNLDALVEEICQIIKI
jgi:cellulose biosynthesis protein BcsQ